MSNRTIDVATIPGEKRRSLLTVSVSYDRRRDGQGIYLKFLPVEKTDMGSVMFCITSLIQMPSIRLETAKRFNRKRLEIAAENIVSAIEGEGSCYDDDIVNQVIEAYEAIRTSDDHKDWGFPAWVSACRDFSVKREALLG